MPKKLIIFCDGTWNEPTKHGTNVLRMLQATESKDAKGDPQLVHYIAGVGTRKGERFRGGTFGLGISNNITDAYSFIVSNYEKGDEIFLFGFSRGAYNARALGGLITDMGLLNSKKYQLDDKALAYRLGCMAWTAHRAKRVNDRGWIHFTSPLAEEVARGAGGGIRAWTKRPYTGRPDGRLR